jgi:branched-chain amino acid transport system substrate-binding protein
MCKTPRRTHLSGRRRRAAARPVARLAAGLLAIAVLGCGETSPGPKAAKLDKTVTIPAILPLTGASSDLGRSVDNGMLLAAADLAAAGQPYRLQVEDSQGLPDQALTAYNALNLGSSGKVVLSWMSSAGRALATHTRADGRLLFVGAALADLTAADGMVVRVWPNALQIGETMATFAARRGYLRVAVLHVNDDYGRSVATAFQKVFEQGSGRVVAREPLAIGQSDYRTPCERIRRARPDALYVPAYGDAYVSGLRQMREVFGDSMPIVADFPLLSSFTLQKVGSAAEGVLVPATDLDLEPRPDGPAQVFAARYLAKYHLEADFNAGLGYMMLTIAARALAARPDGVDLAGAIRGKAFQGPVGELRYDSRNDCTLPIRIARIQGGRAHPVN